MPRTTPTKRLARRFCHALVEETAGRTPESWRTVARRMGILFEEVSTIANDCARREWMSFFDCITVLYAY
jgi:hypothetical protein